jgi:hypothetical protein
MAAFSLPGSTWPYGSDLFLFPCGCQQAAGPIRKNLEPAVPDPRRIGSARKTGRGCCTNAKRFRQSDVNQYMGFVLAASFLVDFTHKNNIRESMFLPN